MNPDYDKFLSFIIKTSPSMPEKDIEEFYSKSQLSRIQKGELVAKEGITCHHLLFIHQGLLRYYFLIDGRDFTKDFAVDKQNPLCTSYTSFMLQKPSKIWIEALEPCLISTWHHSVVSPMFQHHPGWLYFSKKMSDQLFYRKEKKEFELLACSAEERYQHFLDDFPGVDQRVTQYHIATFLGIAPESLSRIRTKFSKSSRAKVNPNP